MNVLLFQHPKSVQVNSCMYYYSPPSPLCVCTDTRHEQSTKNTLERYPSVRRPVVVDIDHDNE